MFWILSSPSRGCAPSRVLSGPNVQTCVLGSILIHFYHTLGVVLGHTKNINSTHYHCSLFLTRPKDIDKRRVILNLSKPYGASLNVSVDKLHFDDRCFILKFPSIDDIIQDIHANNDSVIVKADKGRDFQNLHVNPVNAIKFGICWDDHFYVDVSIAFGLTHGSAMSQMTSDATVFIMNGMGSRPHAYINYYIIVAARHEAQEQFIGWSVIN